MQRVGLLVVVFLASLALLAAGANLPGYATNYVDPLLKIQAQDEALYAASSLEMARGGDWLTPKFMGRLALYKPPLYYWASAISILILGEQPLAVRAPALLAGAATATLVFAWVIGEGSLAAALATALLVCSSHLFFSISRTGLVDGFLVLWLTLAMLILARDTALEQPWSPWLLGFAAGAGMLTKGVAGAMVLMLAAGVALTSAERPRLRRWGLVLGMAFLIAAPWHIYQLAQHPQWFWREYVLTEHVTWGLNTPGQTSEESTLGFYWTRLMSLDPFLTIAGLVALAFQMRKPAARPAAILLGVLTLAVAAYGYRNAAYLMPAVPALAVLIGLSVSPRLAGSGAMLLALLLWAGKMGSPDRPWGLPYAPESQNASHRVLDAYARQHRNRELLLIEPDDQFYAALLRLPRARYLYFDARSSRPRLPLDFEDLGITLTVPSYLNLLALTPEFERRLRAVDLPSTEPLGTAILVSDPGQLSELLAARPAADLYLPARFRSLVSAGYRELEATSGHSLLLAP